MLVQKLFRHIEWARKFSRAGGGADLDWPGEEGGQPGQEGMRQCGLRGGVRVAGRGSVRVRQGPDEHWNIGTSQNQCNLKRKSIPTTFWFFLSHCRTQNLGLVQGKLCILWKGSILRLCDFKLKLRNNCLPVFFLRRILQAQPRGIFSLVQSHKHLQREA